MPPTPARHHAEWLSLIEISGPFLSMPVLLSAFPQGLDDFPPEEARSLRADYEYWKENCADPATHTAWVRLVLESMLGYTSVVLRTGQAIPGGLKAEFPEHEETLRPDMLLMDPGTKKPRLLIQVFPPEQNLEKALRGSRWQASIGTRMMELLHSTETRLGLATNGEQWLLVDAPRGETTGFTTWFAALWFDEPVTLRALRSLLGLRRFFGVPDEETLESLLAKSASDQQEITDQLGLQVRHAVEILIQSLDRADQDQGRKLLGADVPPALLYEAALTVMMRLVFMLSAEERKLLPIDDDRYAAYYAVSTLREQLQSQADRDGEEVLERRYDAWSRLLAVFRAVHGGIQHQDLHSPAYGGSLFDPERYPFLEGRNHLPPHPFPEGKGQEKPLPVNNRTVLHLLDALQMLQVKVPGGGPAEKRRLSFRALDVEQIGHVYEGLLDHRATRASEPVLGLSGAKDQEPEIALSALEKAAAKGQAALLDWLREQTGRGLPALKNALAVDLFNNGDNSGRLRSVCGDEATYQRVLPFAGLIRQDDLGFPVVILPGSVYVTAGTTRRATGTHYTPRSLTEPIVQHTLEPLVYEGPAEGWPKEQWRLRGPDELLELKVCDMAMGSAGFLVQADRYLSERLVEAWGQLTTEETPPDISGLSDDDRLVYARRLVAERCLYGVDKNPLAVEIAKLSLWLVTLSKDRPFTFLDHALKCGDSLVGTSEEEFLRWANRKKSAAMSLDQEVLRESLEEARRLRRQLESFSVRDVHDAEVKADLHRQAEAALAHVKRGADLLAGTKLLGLKAQEIEDVQLGMLDLYLAGELDGEIDVRKHPNVARAFQVAKKEKVFHWEFEFPEVFSHNGFNGIVGNPPFIGGQKITGVLGTTYREYLVNDVADGYRGSADICAYFFLVTFRRLKNNGMCGLIATNTISEGDTREVGLDQLSRSNSSIIRVVSGQKWPGEASLEVSIIWIFKGAWRGLKILDNVTAQNITTFLTDGIQNIAHPIHFNLGRAYMGSIVLGLGFTLDIGEVKQLLQSDSKNGDVIYPYLNGEDLNSNPFQQPSRYIINFKNWPLEKCEQYSACLDIIKKHVKPEREKNKYSKSAKEKWWQYERPRLELYEEINHSEQVMVACRVTKFLMHTLVPSNWVYDVGLNVFIKNLDFLQSFIHSTIYEIWVRQYASTLETRLRYTLTDCFETFPFPDEDLSPMNFGRKYHDYRSQIMGKRQEGLTATYNLFHNPHEHTADIVRLRELHVEMDKAVAVAYGLEDLELGHGFHETAQGTRFTLSEAARREVLARLLKLNHERYEEEVRQGMHEKKTSTRPSPEGRGSGAKSPRRAKGRTDPKILAEVQNELLSFLDDPEPETGSDAAKGVIPAEQIGDWDQVVCLGCGKHLAGFMLKEHTQKVHGGKEPGYRKV